MAQKVQVVHVDQGSGSLSYPVGPPTLAPLPTRSPPASGGVSPSVHGFNGGFSPSVPILGRPLALRPGLDRDSRRPSPAPTALVVIDRGFYTVRHRHPCTYFASTIKCQFNLQVKRKFVNCFCLCVSLSLCIIFRTRSKQAQACNTATCLRISDIFTYLFRYLLIHSITYKICTAATAVQVVQNCSNIVE